MSDFNKQNISILINLGRLYIATKRIHLHNYSTFIITIPWKVVIISQQPRYGLSYQQSNNTNFNGLLEICWLDNQLD